MERPCDKKGPTDGTCPKWDISQNEIYEQFWKYNTQYPPLLSFWRENAENIITQNVFCVENSSSWMSLAPSDLEPVP